MINCFFIIVNVCNRFDKPLTEKKLVMQGLIICTLVKIFSSQKVKIWKNKKFSISIKTTCCFNWPRQIEIDVSSLYEKKKISLKTICFLFKKKLLHFDSKLSSSSKKWQFISLTKGVVHIWRHTSLFLPFPLLVRHSIVIHWKRYNYLLQTENP